MPKIQNNQNVTQQDRFVDFRISFVPHPITGDVVLTKDIQDVVQSCMNLLQLDHYEIPYNSQIGNRCLFPQDGTRLGIRVMVLNTVNMTVEGTIYASGPEVKVMSKTDEATDAWVEVFWY